MAKSLAVAYQMKKKAKKCASGGTVESGDKTMNYAKGGDVKPPPKIIQSGKVGAMGPGYSKGGMVANDTDMSADESPNEFDDLVLRDGLEDNSSAGNQHGGPSKDDLVARAMMRRKAKR